MDKLNFLKMHGTANDFIMINGIDNKNYNYKILAQKLCKRHYSIGADGLIILLNSEKNKNDFKMKIINSDGSEAEMCGNGIRCLTHFIKYLNLSKKNSFKIETKAGIIKTKVIEYNDSLCTIKVNMGKEDFKAENIPVKIEDNEEIIDYEIKAANKKFIITSLSMGNPHTVIFVDKLKNIELEKWGRAIESHYLFPEKTNVEFIEVENLSEVNMEVWERGSGRTLACGTGACASVAAAVKKGLVNNHVYVNLAGGILKIDWSKENIYMTGDSKIVFKGQVRI